MMLKKTGYYKYFFVVLACLLLAGACEKKSETPASTPAVNANKDIFAEGTVAEIGSGWHSLEKADNGGVWRWTNQEAEFTVQSNENAKAAIAVNLKSFSEPRTCDVYLGEKKIATKLIQSEKGDRFEFNAELAKGPNVIKITSPDKVQPTKGQSPTDIRVFAVFSISIKNLP